MQVLPEHVCRFHFRRRHAFQTAGVFFQNEADFPQTVCRIEAVVSPSSHTVPTEGNRLNVFHLDGTTLIPPTDKAALLRTGLLERVILAYWSF